MGRRFKPRNDTGSMLASSIVIVGGAAFCVMLAAVGSNEPSPWLIAGVIGTTVCMLLLMVRIRYGERGSGLGFWHSVFRNHRQDGLASEYRPEKVDSRSASSGIGSNAPITAEQVHEIQVTSANTWVPSRNKEGRQKNRGQATG